MHKRALLSPPTNNVSLPQRGKLPLVCMTYTYHPFLLGKVFCWQSVGCQQNLTFWFKKEFLLSAKDCQGLWEPSTDPKVSHGNKR